MTKSKIIALLLSLSLIGQNPIEVSKPFEIKLQEKQEASLEKNKDFFMDANNKAIEYKLEQEKMQKEKLEREKVEKQKIEHERIYILAKLIQSEALSEPYEGKVAVGSVVLNRMHHYNKSINEIIYAKYQFAGVNTRLFNQEPSEDCLRAAQEAMSGLKPVGDAIYFVDLNIVRPSWVNEVNFVSRIGNHWFYRI